MHKKLASDLTSLAHSILQMKNKEDVFALRDKAHEIYEKLAVLAYVEEYINNTPNPAKSREELLQEITEAATKKEAIAVSVEKPLAEEKKVVHSLEEDEEKQEQETKVIADKVIEEKIELKEVEEITGQPFEELEEILFNDDNKKSDIKDVGAKKTPTLEEELKDTLPVDVMANLFEKVDTQKTLNDKLQSSIQIGLNDRIAFVKHLFSGDQADFNRVMSQLNTLKTEKEAKKFINKMVKPDYDWSEKEEYETRLFEIIARRFS